MSAPSFPLASTRSSSFRRSTHLENSDPRLPAVLLAPPLSFPPLQRKKNKSACTISRRARPLSSRFPPCMAWTSLYVLCDRRQTDGEKSRPAFPLCRDFSRRRVCWSALLRMVSSRRRRRSSRELRRRNKHALAPREAPSASGSHSGLSLSGASRQASGPSAAGDCCWAGRSLGVKAPAWRRVRTLMSWRERLAEVSTSTRRRRALVERGREGARLKGLTALSPSPPQLSCLTPTYLSITYSQHPV